MNHFRPLVAIVLLTGWLGAAIEGSAAAPLDDPYPDSIVDPDAPVNGCGSQGEDGTDVPDFSFTDACNWHDQCYGTLGLSRDYCDRGMRHRSLQSCPPAPLHLVCRDLANLYYLGVRQFGQEPYQQGQENARRREDEWQTRCRFSPSDPECADEPAAPNLELPRQRRGGGVVTDPHLVTFDGLRYDFQGVGEYTAVHGDDLEVQARFTNVQSGNASFTVAVAAKLPGSNQAFSVYAEDVGPETWTVYLGNDRFLVSAGESRLGDYVLTLDGARLRVDTDDGGMGLDIDSFESDGVDGFSFYFDLDEGLVPTVFGGVIGDADGDRSNDYRLPNGMVIPVDEMDFDTLYRTFGEAWRVKTTEESLFVYGPGEDPSTFHNPRFPSGEVTLATLTQTELLRGLRPCLEAGVWVEPALSACAFDVSVTDDDMWVQTGTRSQQRLPQTASPLALPDGLFNSHSGYILWEHDDFVVRALIAADATGSAARLVIRGLEVEADGSTTLIFPGWAEPPPSIDLPGDRELRLSLWGEVGLVATLDGSLDGVTGLATEKGDVPADGIEGTESQRFIAPEAAQNWETEFPTGGN